MIRAFGLWIRCVECYVESGWRTPLGVHHAGSYLRGALAPEVVFGNTSAAQADAFEDTSNAPLNSLRKNTFGRRSVSRHRFSRADKPFMFVIPRGLLVRGESVFPTFSATSKGVLHPTQACGKCSRLEFP